MASSDLERFVQAIVDDHGLATGIKTLGSHYDLVAYANLRGFAIPLAEWGRFVAMDSLQASDEAITLALRADPAHWSWAFRQISKWRGLLMDGAGSDGLLGAAEFAVSPSRNPPANLNRSRMRRRMRRLPPSLHQSAISRNSSSR